MGYVSGESLRDRLKRRGRLEPDEARDILSAMAGALHYAHEQGVIHRDVKPDNILLEDRTGKPMLTDFGVAKSAVSGETLTALGTVLGTPYYMSPEQAAGDRDIDGRSDLYSLGVIGYQMLTGQLPFEGETVRGILVQHMTREPVALKTLAPTAPDDLAQTITRCLAKNPDDRVPDAEVLRRALDRELGEEDEDLPEGLHKVMEYVRGVPLTTGASWYLAYWTLLWGDVSTAVGLFAIGAVWPLAPVAERRKRKLTGHSWKSILKRAFRKPKWWSLWWPRFLRRPEDLWDRMPKEARGARAAVGWLIAIGIAIIPPIIRMGLGPPSLLWVIVVKKFMPWVVVPLVGGSLVPLVRSAFWYRRAGLTGDEWERFLGASESDVRFWRQPHIQKLLAPPANASDRLALPVPKTPRDYVGAFEQAARALEGDERAIAEQAVTAGREVGAALEELERQIKSLARDADPAERARLEQRLVELGDATPSESDAQRRMRELVQEQLELARGLAAQLDAARERRDRLMDLLKTLWLQVANLRARATEAAFDSGEISDKIRAISEDIQRYVEAADETIRLLSPNNSATPRRTPSTPPTSQAVPPIPQPPPGGRAGG